MFIRSLICQQSVFKRYRSDKHLSEFYLQDGGKNQLAQIWNKITSLSSYVYKCDCYQIAAHKFETSQLRYVKANINIVNIVRHV